MLDDVFVLWDRLAPRRRGYDRADGGTDRTFGTRLQSAASEVVEASAGKDVGAMWVSLQAPDLSSLLLRAQDSGAQVLGLANAGTDFIHSLKAANESGITKAMKPVGPRALIPNVDSLGLEVAQGLILTTA
jgi:branched-chain amino acid transport system substrate-binding protein